MVMLLVMGLIFFVVLAVLLGLSIGLAWLLQWLLPGVGMEMALLVAVLAVGQAMLIFGRVLNALPPPGIDDIEPYEPPITVLDRELSLPRRRRKRS